jgi:cytochrome c556
MAMFKWAALGAVFALGASLSAAEKPTENYTKLMRTAGASMQSIGKNADAKNYDAIAADAATLKSTFTEVGKFWTEKKIETALTACRATFQAASDLETAAKAKNDEGIATARKALGGGCQSCHMQHREKTADGFEIK